MNQNYPTFRGLLRGAICNRTQAQFANESGISAEHLNRMLNAGKIHRPTKTTLLKIASAAKNGITYQTLLDALDKDDGVTSHPSETRIKQAQQDFKPDFQTAAHETMKALVSVLKQIKYPVMTESIADHIAEILDKTAKSGKPDLLPISYDINTDLQNFGTFCEHAARYVRIDLSMADRFNTAESDMMVYFTDIACENNKTQYVIHKVTCSIEAIMDQFGMPPAALDYADEQLKNPDNKFDTESFSYAMAMDYYLDFAPVIRFKEAYNPRAKTAEGKLFEQLFGQTVKYSQTFDGLGFLLKNIPENLATFLHQHMKPVLDAYDDPRDQDMIETAQKLETAIREWGILNDSPGIAKTLDELEYQDSNGRGDTGWGAAIAEVMRAETGFDFYYHAPAKDLNEFPNLSKAGCILVEKSAWEDNRNRRESILQAIARYARILGINRFGDILFTNVKIDSRKPRIYVIKDDPNSDNDADIDIPELEYTVEFNPDNGPWPDEPGLYAVELKDGRHMNMILLKTPKPIWLKCHKEWSHLIARYCPHKFPMPEVPEEPEDEPANE